MNIKIKKILNKKNKSKIICLTAYSKNVASILDTLKLARDKHPGQKNNLNALCRRYDIDNSNRELHGALLDSEILADVYLAMTGGQVSLTLTAEEPKQLKSTANSDNVVVKKDRQPLRVIKANEAELNAHEENLQRLQKASNGECVWLAK